MSIQEEQSQGLIPKKRRQQQPPLPPTPRNRRVRTTIQSENNNNNNINNDKKIESFYGFSSFVGNFLVAAKYVWAETKKSKRSFLIGCMTVTLVVFSNSLLQNTVSYAPLLFLKLAEDTIGEYDLLLAPRTKDPMLPSFSVNSTEISQKLAAQPLVSGVAGRWLMISTILNSKERSKNSSTIMLILDSKKEKEIGLGRQWPFPPLSGRSCYVAAALMRCLGSQVGDSTTIRFDFFDLLHTMSGSTDSDTEFIRSTLVKFVSSTPLASNATNNDSIPVVDIAGLLRGLIPTNNNNNNGLNLDNLIGLLQTQANRDTLNGIISRRFGLSLKNLINAESLTDEQLLALKESLSLEIPLTIAGIIQSPKGKYPDSLGNAIVLEMDLWNEILRNAISRIITDLTQDFLNSVLGSVGGLPITDEQKDTILNRIPLFSVFKTLSRTLDMREYALTAVVMYKNRLTTFMKENRELDKDMIAWTNNIMEILGTDYPVTVSAPLIQALRVLYYLRLFLDQLLLIVEIFLVGLGMLLIYSLLLADVEGKVYECGMLRAMGMKQYTLIQLLVLQSLLFSVPGIATGLLFGFLGFVPVGGYFAEFSGVPIPFSLTLEATGLGIVVGLVMPMVALVGPVQRSLSKSLRDALDLYHSMSSDTVVTFVSLEKLGISATQMNLSILSIMFGFVVYYLIPYSFIFFYWALFFNIFVIILLAMVLGLALIGMVFHPLGQLLSVHMLIWGPDRKHLKSLVQKNLSGHGSRNSKTSILFTICISFIIFAGTIFNQQAITMEAKAKIGIGGDVVIASMRQSLPLDHASLVKYLEEEIKRPGTIVKSYTFSTFPLNQIPYSVIERTDLASLADYATSRVLVYGVDKNFLDATYDEYMVVKELNKNYEYEKTPNGGNDIIRSLWDHPSQPESFPEGNFLFTNQVKKLQNRDLWGPQFTKLAYEHPIDVIISEATRIPSSLDTTMPVEIRASVAIDQNGRFMVRSNMYFLGKVRAMASCLSGFLLSSYPQTATFSPIIVSMESYMFLQSVIYNYSYVQSLGITPPTSPPIKALFIKVTEESSISERDDLINALKNFVPDDLAFIANTKDVLKSTQTAIMILNIFFDVVSIIVIILCFFLLFVSFTTNVNENAWEFGVLRAIGMTAFQVVRVYIYEALAIVLASVMLGFLIGDMVSVTLALQSCLWSELPFTFHFPTILFCGVVLMSLIVAVLGSYLPASILQKKKIASALKNL